MDGKRGNAGIARLQWHSLKAFAMNFFKKFKDYVLGEVRSLGQLLALLSVIPWMNDATYSAHRT